MNDTDDEGIGHHGAGLSPCPFCGAGEIQVQESKHWTGMRSQIISVTVRHWCARPDGQPRSMIQMVGRDHESAIATWNRRTP